MPLAGISSLACRALCLTRLFAHSKRASKQEAFDDMDVEDGGDIKEVSRHEEEEPMDSGKDNDDINDNNDDEDNDGPESSRKSPAVGRSA